MSAVQAQGWFTDPARRRVSTAFDDRETAPSRRLNAALALALQPGASSLLDIGCGGGEMLREVRALAPGIDLVGVDPVPDAVAAARRTFEGDDRAQFLVGPAEGLPTLVKRPDIVVSHLNFGLWTEPLTALTGILRLLAPGGLFYLVDVAAATTDDQRAAFLGLARNNEEAHYLEDQLAAAVAPETLEGLLLQAASRARRQVDVHVARGGLAGYPYDDHAAAMLWLDVNVQRALREMPATGAASAADVVLTAVVRSFQ